jgi:hypothetical protein
MSTKPQTIHALDAGQALTLPPTQGQRLHVIFGCLWVTQSGRPEDRFLYAGHNLLLDDQAHVVIQAEGGAARYVVTPEGAARRVPSARNSIHQGTSAPTCGLTAPSRKPAAA